MTKHVEEFVAYGFTIVHDLFTEVELERLDGALERVIEKVRANPDNFQARFTYTGDSIQDTWGVNNILQPSLYEAAFGDIFLNQGVMSLVKKLIGERLRFWYAHALWSPQHVDYELNWHRDYGDHDRHDPYGRSTHVQFNVCLTDDACFRAIPGSHRRPLNEREAAQQHGSGIALLPDEVVAQCHRGDVLFMNAHTLHRGACSVATHRRTMHVSLQPVDEPTGGQSSWRYMREPGYLERMNPVVRELMENAIAWDDTHRLSMIETRRLMKIGNEIKSHRANALGKQQ